MDSELIHALQDPARYPHPVSAVRVEETHISWVLLTGDFAYKIKKPLDLGFLDYSTLPRRLACCEEELRLNRRFAPQLYLDVVAIGGSPAAPELPATGTPIEYAVRMRQFPADARLDLRLADGRLERAHIDQLAAVVAAIHAQAPRSTDADRFGTPDQVFAPVAANFELLDKALEAPADRACLQAIAAWSRAQRDALQDQLARRKRDGWIRECHGDLHLGNIAWVDEAPTLFDGIEFNADLRWIDVISEAAFLSMDLIDRGRADLAWRWLNGYLVITGDYAGVGLLRFYQCYRALVRAKVAMIRHSQADHPAGALAQARDYLALGSGFTHPPPALLLVMHGLSGSGKTFVSGRLLEDIGTLRLRSDIERKRLAGLPAERRSGSGVGTGLYTREMSDATYARLETLARGLLIAGQRVIVDAACLSRAQRNRWRAVADELRIPRLFISCRAPESLLHQRIADRVAQGCDASEADEAVLAAQLRHQEPLADDETADSLVIDSCDNDWPAAVKTRIDTLLANAGL